MAPIVVAVAGAGGGVGATGFALALAWSHAERGQTMLVDADGGGGTAADVLGIQDQRSLANAYGATGISATDIERQAVVVRDRPRLRVVPGFRDPGPPADEVSAVLAAGLAALPDELVVVDLGAPFAYPGLVRRDRVGMAVGSAFPYVLIVVRLEADLLARTVRTLSAARVPRARLVLVRPPTRSSVRGGVREATALVRERCPDYPVALEWDWDPGRWLAARARSQPAWREGIAEDLGLVGDGRVRAPRRSLAQRWLRRPEQV